MKITLSTALRLHYLHFRIYTSNIYVTFINFRTTTKALLFITYFSTALFERPRKTGPNRSLRLILPTRLPRKVTMATFCPLLRLAMTDHGLRATAHVGPIHLLLVTTDSTCISRSLHYPPPPPARTCSKTRNSRTIPRTNICGITPLKEANRGKPLLQKIHSKT